MKHEILNSAAGIISIDDIEDIYKIASLDGVECEIDLLDTGNEDDIYLLSYRIAGSDEIIRIAVKDDELNDALPPATMQEVKETGDDLREVIKKEEFDTSGLLSVDENARLEQIRERKKDEGSPEDISLSPISEGALLKYNGDDDEKGNMKKHFIGGEVYSVIGIEDDGGITKIKLQNKDGKIIGMSLNYINKFFNELEM